MKSHNKLTDYYFTAAKNDDAEFTHSELLSVVESATDDNPRGTGNYFTKQTLRRIIMLSLLPLAGTIAATFLWLSAPQATQKERTNTPVNPAKQTPAPAPTIVQTEKKLTSMPRQSVQQTLSKGHPMKKTDSPNALNIQGITAIELAKSELGGLGVTVNKDCGISVSNGVMIGTYYNTNLPPSKEGSKLTDGKEDSYLKHSYSQWVLPTSTAPVAHKSYPLLVTSIQGVILSDGLGNRVEDQVVSTEIQKSIDSIAAHNPNNKSTVAFFLYPNDSSMNNEDFQRQYLSLRNLNTKDSSLTMENVRKIVGDTSNLSVVFKRLTQADVDKMERDTRLRAEKINEYLRLNKLIAIRVNADCPNTSLILWYEPTEEFINNLTERYRADLQKEMLGKGNMQVTTDTLWLDANTSQEKPQTGCQFTDICRATSGAVLESNVFPNPATEKISLTFRLNADRRCTFSLHDLNGIYIKDLGTDVQYLKGEQTFTAPIGETGAGVYLLSMHTDKDERIVQRVIIKK
ncbi:MAG: T9SS type A sorting domain-containing protein [Ignavibacteria bacterium]|nr:T9SS type A sorting domain-containing protein [Ignavibacteria bacterium]